MVRMEPGGLRESLRRQGVGRGTEVRTKEGLCNGGKGRHGEVREVQERVGGGEERWERGLGGHGEGM